MALIIHWAGAAQRSPNTKTCPAIILLTRPASADGEKPIRQSLVEEDAMSDSQRYRTREGEVQSGRKPIETVWNILGFGFAIVMGAAGFMGADWFLLENEVRRWVYLPPEVAWPAVAPFLALKIGVALTTLFLGGAVFTLLYGLVQPVTRGRYDVEASGRDLRRNKK